MKFSTLIALVASAEAIYIKDDGAPMKCSYKVPEGAINGQCKTICEGAGCDTTGCVEKNVQECTIGNQYQCGECVENLTSLAQKKDAAPKFCTYKVPANTFSGECVAECTGSGCDGSGCTAKTI